MRDRLVVVPRAVASFFLAGGSCCCAGSSGRGAAWASAARRWRPRVRISRTTATSRRRSSSAACPSAPSRPQRRAEGRRLGECEARGARRWGSVRSRTDPTRLWCGLLFFSFSAEVCEVLFCWQFMWAETVGKLGLASFGGALAFVVACHLLAPFWGPAAPPRRGERCPAGLLPLAVGCPGAGTGVARRCAVRSWRESTCIIMFYAFAMTSLPFVFFSRFSKMLMG